VAYDFGAKVGVQRFCGGLVGGVVARGSPGPFHPLPGCAFFAPGRVWHFKLLAANQVGLIALDGTKFATRPRPLQSEPGDDRGRDGEDVRPRTGEQ
jgi:hypothetical protein